MMLHISPQINYAKHYADNVDTRMDPLQNSFSSTKRDGLQSPQ